MSILVTVLGAIISIRIPLTEDKLGAGKRSVVIVRISVQRPREPLHNAFGKDAIRPYFCLSTDLRKILQDFT